MTLQTINLGGYANDGTGDDLRTAFQKVNFNFDILRYEVAGATNLGSGIGVFAQKNDVNLEFKSLTSNDNSVILTDTSDTVNLQSITTVLNDSSPMLGGDLGLNGFTIKAINGGGIESKVWNVDIQLLSSLVSIMIESSNSKIDLGTFLIPSGRQDDTNRPNGYILDFGTILDPASGNNIDFGSF